VKQSAQTKAGLGGLSALVQTAGIRSLMVYLAFVGMAVGGLLLRLHHLAAKGLSDEAASWTFARLGWTRFWEVMWEYEGNMVFYYLLLRGWIRLGDSELILRSLSVIFGIAAVIALYRFGSRLFSNLTGLIAAALLAVHALHIEYSQDARSYSLLMFLVILSCQFFVNAVEQPTRKRYWAAYVAVSSLAFYSHILAVLVFAAQWLSVRLARLRRIGLPTTVVVSATLIAILFPGIVFVATNNRGQLQWVEPLSWDLASWVIRTFTGDGGVYLSALYIATALAAIDPADWRIRFTIGWLIGPIVALLAISVFTPVLTTRFMLMCLPALALLSARGMVRLGAISGFSRCVSCSIFALLLFLSLRGDTRYFGYAQASGVSFNPMTRYILDRAAPDDGIFFFTAATHMSFKYYAERRQQENGAAENTTPAILFPSFGDMPTGAQPTPTRSEVQAAVRGHRRVWLVLNNSSIALVEGRESAARMIRSTLEDTFRVAKKKLFSKSPKLTVVLYVRRDGMIDPTNQARRR
jgi:mannosyltransferase